MRVSKSYKSLAGLLVAQGLIAASGCVEDRLTAPVSTDSGPAMTTSFISASATFDASPEKLSNLLNFETPTDSVFISTEPADGAKVVPAQHRGGNAALQIAAGTTQLKVKLASLLSGRQFPADWTLLGGYVCTAKPVGLTLQLDGEDGPLLPPQHVRIEPNAWRAAMLDVTSLAGKGAGVVGPALRPTLLIRFDEPLSAPIWLDDVEMLDNTMLLAGDDGASLSAGTWNIRRLGYQYVGSATGRFAFRLVSKQADPLGWECVEANAMRARFRSEGRPKDLTIYADGRSYSDGKYQPIIGKDFIESDLGEQHISPAEIDVPAEQGKVDRRTTGDANNDGYNETRGAFEVVASGQRIEATLTPRTAALVRPVIEIAKFPAGKVLATLEGRLVEKTARLADGTLLVELPGRVTRPTTLTLRLQ